MSRSRVLCWSMILLALVLLLLPPAPALAQDEEGDPETTAKFLNSRARMVASVDVDGKSWALGDLIGKKVVFINFWGVRCGPCVAELPLLNKFHKTYREQGLALVAVNVDGYKGEDLKAEMAKLKIAIDYTSLIDPDFIIADAYEMTGAPLSIMIDKKGVIRYYHVGYSAGETDKHYLAAIEALLKE